MKTNLVAALLLVPVTALAWTMVEPGVVAVPKKAAFTVQLPSGWLYDTAAGVVIASRDGALLNEIRVVLAPHDQVFKNIKKKSSADALPEDLAELYVESLHANKGVHDIEVLSTEPADLAGRPAFRVHIRYRIPEEMGGATFERVTVGTPLPAGLLLAYFEAPQLYQYPKWEPAFEESLKTITVAP